MRYLAYYLCCQSTESERNNLISASSFILFFLSFAAFEIIHPVVFQSADPASRDFQSSHRKKRSALWGTNQISVNISTINDHFHIKLTPNKHLLSPSFKVYHRHHGNEGYVTADDDVININDDTACHFHGVIESHGQAKAALSLCRGVVSLLVYSSSFQPQHDKTNKMTCAPSEDSAQPGHPPSLISVFVVRMKPHWVLSYPLRAQRRL